MRVHLPIYAYALAKSTVNNNIKRQIIDSALSKNARYSTIYQTTVIETQFIIIILTFYSNLVM